MRRATRRLPPPLPLSHPLSHPLSRVPTFRSPLAHLSLSPLVSQVRRKLTSAEEVSAVANEATRAQERCNALRRQGDEKARKLIDMSNEYALPSLLPLAPWHAHILTSFGAHPLPNFLDHVAFPPHHYTPSSPYRL